jgi:hypothetical protein
MFGSTVAAEDCDAIPLVSTDAELGSALLLRMVLSPVAALAARSAMTKGKERNRSRVAMFDTPLALVECALLRRWRV